jgi:L-cysteine S-thiosulfotransferase
VSGRRYRKAFWRVAAVSGGVWLAVLGASRIAVGAEEPQPGIPWARQKSGVEFQSKSNRERQEDLTVNPGMLWVDQGAQMWSKAEGAAGKSCQDCHGAPETMKGVAARYPVWDAKAGRLHSLDTRVQQCRSERQKGAPLAPESEGLLALTALVAHQSRGMPVAPSIDGPARAVFDLGRLVYEQRAGQLNLSCAHCHEQSWGQRLRAETVSQGQSNGYPIYRLEWQKLGSLHRRLRSCYLSVRGEPPQHGSEEHLALELYLAWRAKGLAVETPAVRR